MAIAYRKEKLASQMVKEVSQIIQFELTDPRKGFATVQRVELSDDLRYAKVFVSILGQEKDKKLTMAGLKSAQGFVQHLISRRLMMRYAPEISFVRDDSIEKTMKLTQMLDEIAKKSPKAAPKKAPARKAAPAKKAAPKKPAKPAPARRDDEDDGGGKSEEE